MDLSTILEISTERSKKWHDGDINNWSTMEWAGAMAGEAGEAVNAAKKLKRLEGHIKSINEPGRHYSDMEAARAATVREVADTILYGVLVAARCGLSGADFEQVVRDVFNRKSEEYGFPERL